MAKVNIVGFSLPASTARAIPSPAPINLYADGPMSTQATCANAAAVLSPAANAREMLPTVGMRVLCEA